MGLVVRWQTFIWRSTSTRWSTPSCGCVRVVTFEKGHDDVDERRTQGDGGVVMTGGGAWRRDQIRNVQEGVGSRGYEYMLCYAMRSI